MDGAAVRSCLLFAVQVDGSKNAALSGAEGRFDADGSRAALWVIPTDEELLIARDTFRVVTGAGLEG